VAVQLNTAVRDRGFYHRDFFPRAAHGYAVFCWLPIPGDRLDQEMPAGVPAGLENAKPYPAADDHAADDVDAVAVVVVVVAATAEAAETVAAEGSEPALLAMIEAILPHGHQVFFFHDASAYKEYAELQQ
jgi:hypothetical protein